MIKPAVPGSESVHISLLENSHAFLQEGVRKALAARDDARQWQFAIVNLVQSLELSLKVKLKELHPLLVFADVDSPRHTVSSLQALKRLASSIGLTKKDQQCIERAIALRNQMMHSEFELRPAYAQARFFEAFAYVVYFQATHLHFEVEKAIGKGDLEKLLTLRKAVSELVKRALQRIREEGIEEGALWECPTCRQGTFVTGIDQCYTCRESQEVVECPHCSEQCFDFQLESFFDDLDTDYDEGRVIVHNNYGYTKHSACPECIDRIRDKIEEERWEHHYNLIDEHPTFYQFSTVRR